MDLVYVFRKYRNIKSLIISLFIIMMIIYVVIVTCYVVNDKQRKKIFEEYKVNQSIAIEKENLIKIELAQKEAEEKRKKHPNLTKDGINEINNIYKLEGKKAYLTFDDGPSKTVTPLILEILKKENVKATFFLLGSRVDLNPDLVRQEYDEGHYIANHGYSHIYSKIYTSVDTVLEEFYKTEQSIKHALGDEEYDSHLFRFPGGLPGGKYSKLKQLAAEELNSQNIAYMDWNALTGDAEGKTTKEAMLNYLKQTVGNKQNVVILMHDTGDKYATAEVLPEVISFLRENGYEFENFYSLMK